MTLKPIGEILPGIIADIQLVSRHLSAREIDARVTAAVRAAVADSDPVPAGEPVPSITDPTGCLA